VKRSVEETLSSTPAPIMAPIMAPIKATTKAPIKAPPKAPTKGRKAVKVMKPIDANTEGKTVGKTEKPEIEDSREAIQNRLEQEKDTMELKMAIVTELDDYHEVQHKIKFLEDHLQQHANFHVVNDKEILDASQTLKEMKEKIINPLEHNLVAVRNQILKMDHALNDKDKIFIKSVLENADQFLSTSKSRLESLELVEQLMAEAEKHESARKEQNPHGKETVPVRPNWSSTPKSTCPRTMKCVQRELCDLSGGQGKAGVDLHHRGHILDDVDTHPRPRIPCIDRKGRNILGICCSIQAISLKKEWESLEESDKIKISTKADSKASVESGDESLGGGLRSQRLQKIRNIVASKINEHERKTESVQIKNIDIAMLKKELEREKMLDTEPGYGRKIKAALNEAAEKSHKFIHDKLAHGHSDTDITHEDGSIKFSWILVFVFGTLSIVLTGCLVCLLLNRPTTNSLRRKLFKDDTTFGYCELNDVRGEVQRGVATSSSWNEDSWGNWDDSKAKNSQKLK